MATFLEYVENRIESAPNDRFMAYAGASFLKSSASHFATDLSVSALRAWTIDMLVGGLKKNTRRRYFSRIHTLYQAWRSGAGPDPFDEVREIVECGTDGCIAKAKANLALVKRMLRTAPQASDFENIAIFLYLLYNVEATLADVIALTFDSPAPDISQLSDLIDPMSRSCRKRYVFGLGQGKRREPQIAGSMLRAVHESLTKRGIDFGESFSRESVTALWITAAMKLGIAPGEIRSMLRRLPDEYAYLRYVDPATLTPRRRSGIMQRVADSINDRSGKWFIMRLRAGRTPDDIKQCIADNFATLHRDITFYYPTRTVVRLDRRGRKHRDTEPYLPGILFFRMRCDKVATLFSRIGDMAWCYRTSAIPGSPYCTIPPSEMKKFQMHIGKFTPDIRMELVSRTEALPAGSAVRINGGGRMEGYIGVIDSVRNADGTRTYTLLLSDSDVARWTVEDIDEIYVQPVNP